MKKLEELSDEELVSHLIDAASELGRNSGNMAQSGQRCRDKMVKHRDEIFRRLSLQNKENEKTENRSRPDLSPSIC